MKKCIVGVGRWIRKLEIETANLANLANWAGQLLANYSKVDSGQWLF